MTQNIQDCCDIQIYDDKNSPSHLIQNLQFLVHQACNRQLQRWLQHCPDEYRQSSSLTNILLYARKYKSL